MRNFLLIVTAITAVIVTAVIITETLYKKAIKGM